MKPLFFCLCSFFLAPFFVGGVLNAQNVWFIIESGLLKDSAGNAFSPSNDVYVYGGTFDSNYSVPQLEDSIQSIRDATLTSPSLAASQLQNLVNGFDVWGVVQPVSPESPASGVYDWSSILDGIAGSKAYMLVLTTPMAEIDVFTQVGIVSLAEEVPSLSTLIVGFETPEPDRWNEFFMGSSGSLTLETIPEPGVYAGLLGVSVFVLALMRRRRR